MSEDKIKKKLQIMFCQNKIKKYLFSRQTSILFQLLASKPSRLSIYFHNKQPYA